MPRLIQGRALHTALGKVNRQEYGNQGGRRAMKSILRCWEVPLAGMSYRVCLLLLQPY